MQQPLFRDPEFRKEFSDGVIRGEFQSPTHPDRPFHLKVQVSFASPVSILGIGVTLFQVPWDFASGRIP